MAGVVACFGELLLRLTAPGRELLLQRPRLDVYPGGAEANVAVGLSCLGHRTKMISIVPNNELGRFAVGYLRGHGVDTSGIRTGEGRMGLYFLTPGASLRPSEIIYDRQQSSFALSAAEMNWDEALRGVDLLHMSGVTPAIGPQAADMALAAAAAARRLNIAISFDGNYREQMWKRWQSDPRSLLAQLVGQADFFFGNHRDIGLLLDRPFSGEGAERRREAAEAAFRAFPNLKFISSTARHLKDADRHLISARIDTPHDHSQTEEVLVAGIVDRIGTGDAFAAGILHGLRNGRPLEWTVRSGLALGCLKHSLPGDAALFDPEAVETFMTGELDVRR